MHASDWYGWDGTTQHGPLTLEELRRRIAGGQLPPHTQVKQGPNGAWGPLPALPGGGSQPTPLAVAHAGPAPGYSALPAEAPPEVGRAVVVGALTGLGVVLVSAVVLLVRYAVPAIAHPLMGDDSKWRVGLVIAAAVVARMLASGPRRDVHALLGALLAAWVVGGSGPMGISVAVIVQLRARHALMVALPAFVFCMAGANREIHFDDGRQVMTALAAGLPILLWLAGALGAGAIARRFTPGS